MSQIVLHCLIYIFRLWTIGVVLIYKAYDPFQLIYSWHRIILNSVLVEALSSSSFSSSSYLSDVVLVQAPLQPYPRLGLEVGDLLDHLEDVSHVLDGDHLLVPQAYPQVADALDGRLDVRLLVRLYVDEALDVFRRHHRLDLQRLHGDTWTAGSGTRETGWVKQRNA